MASAKDFTRALSAPLVTFFLTAHAPAYGAAPEADTVCLKSNITLAPLPVPPHILGDMVRIYNELGNLLITPENLEPFMLSDTQTIRDILEAHLEDPDELEDALLHVLPYFEKFWEQRALVENDWEAMSDTARRDALMNTVIGLKTIDQIFADGFLDRIATAFSQPDAFRQAIDNVTDTLGAVEMQDYDVAYDNPDCAVPAQMETPASPSEMPTQKYDNFLLG